MYNLEYSQRYNEAMAWFSQLGINVGGNDMACKLIEPISENELCVYKGHYFCRRRHRNGKFYEPEQWLGITEDYYEMFKKAGSKVRTLVPKQVIEYMETHYPDSK